MLVVQSSTKMWTLKLNTFLQLGINILVERNIPRVYRGSSLSASGRISCPDDVTVAQNLR